MNFVKQRKTLCIIRTKKKFVKHFGLKNILKIGFHQIKKSTSNLAGLDSFSQVKKNDFFCTYAIVTLSFNLWPVNLFLAESLYIWLCTRLIWSSLISEEICNREIFSKFVSLTIHWVRPVPDKSKFSKYQSQNVTSRQSDSRMWKSINNGDNTTSNGADYRKTLTCHPLADYFSLSTFPFVT